MYELVEHGYLTVTGLSEKNMTLPKENIRNSSHHMVSQFLQRVCQKLVGCQWNYPELFMSGAIITKFSITCPLNLVSDQPYTYKFSS
jgi:hypothetical protein